MIASGALASAEPGPVADEYWHERTVLEDRLAEDPDDVEALARTAKLLQDSHQPEPAAERYRRLLAIDPTHRQAWLDLASVEAEAGDWGGALEATRGLLAAFPDDPEGLWNLGAIHANGGRIEEARAAWRRATEQTRDQVIAEKAADALEQMAGAAER